MRFRIESATRGVLRYSLILLCSLTCRLALGEEGGTLGAATDRLPPTQAAAQENYSKKLICKRENVTGSLVRKKVCRTQAQIDADQEASAQFLHDINQNAGNGGRPQ